MNDRPSSIYAMTSGGVRVGPSCHVLYIWSLKNMLFFVFICYFLNDREKSINKKIYRDPNLLKDPHKVLASL